MPVGVVEGGVAPPVGTVDSGPSLEQILARVDVTLLPLAARWRALLRS